MKKKEHYITIHSWMIQDYDLKGLELLLYAIIFGFTIGKEVGYYGSRRTLAEMTNSTKNGVDKALKNLLNKKLICKDFLIKKKKRFPVYLALKPEIKKSHPSSFNISSDDNEESDIPIRSTKKVKIDSQRLFSDINSPTLRKGLFENVILTQELLDRLTIEAPDHYEAYIKRLDIHIEKSNNKTKFEKYTPYQFYLTILDWLERDNIINDPGLI